MGKEDLNSMKRKRFSMNERASLRLGNKVKVNYLGNIVEAEVAGAIQEGGLGVTDRVKMKTKLTSGARVGDTVMWWAYPGDFLLGFPKIIDLPSL